MKNYINIKKIIFVVIIAALAAVNVNLVFKSNESVVDLTLSSIMALARGENTKCSICGYDIDACSCDDYGITCDHGSCSGKVCHENTDNPLCWCRANGISYSFCI